MFCIIWKVAMFVTQEREGGGDEGEKQNLTRDR